MKTLRYALLSGLFFAITACGNQPAAVQSGEVTGQQVAVTGGSYKDLSVSELQTFLDNKDFVFVNVHIPFEGDLPETDLSVPFNDVAQLQAQLPADKDAKIVLYCRSGNMSSQAAKTLVSLGYTNVWNLAGGFNAWKVAGLPMAGE